MRDNILYAVDHLRHRILAHGYNEREVFGDNPVYAVIHIPAYKIKQFHGVILYQRIDKDHSLIISKRLYRWIIETGKVIHNENRFYSCRLCNVRFRINHFLKHGHYIHFE